MWLIRVADHKLVDFVYEKRPEYAILSHRWDEFNPEVGFQDMLDSEKASLMPNFNKILNACGQAAMDGIKFIWIDTCCINKESSAELTEAINSMYDWYKAAKVCYALLADVVDNADAEGILDQISSSEWFTRGWTLQELIAPDVVVFLNQSWQRLGTKLSLRASLTARTGINTAVLTGWEPPSSRSIAERMSWASQRKTTRVEDEAYCLLGLFGVNMPMLYGEGTRAFRRLQEEIMKVSDDQSIFAWPLPKRLAAHQDPGTNSLTDSIEGRSDRVRQLFGLLADSPTAFKTCASISRKASRKGTPPYTMTNRGLSISLWAGVVEVDTYLVRLNCDDSSVAADKGDDNNCQLGIFLTCLDGDEQFARVADNEGRSIRRLSSELYDGFATLHFFIPQNRDFEPVETSNFDVLRPRVNGIRLKTPDSFDFYELVSSYKWDDKSHLLTQAAQPGLNRCHLAERGITLDLGEDTSTEIQKMTFAIDRACNPVCFVATAKGLQHDVELEPTSSVVTTNRGLTALEQSKTWSHPFLTRRPYDDLEWSTLLHERDSNHDYDDVHVRPQLSVSKDVYAVELEYYSGIWAIKGDRVEGISAHILPESLTSPLGHVSMKRSVVEWGQWRGHSVWDVSFTDPPVEEESW